MTVRGTSTTPLAPPILDRRKRAERVAVLVSRAIVTELEQQEGELMAVCREVAEASDALHEAREAGRGEWSAVRTLHAATKRLKTLIDRKERG